ncbi:hypothetical protein FRC01_004268, partial [Tulasnella sp. 417]
VRYALSPDNEFGPTGQYSGIPYLEDFEYYRKCLMVGQRKKVPAVLDLFDDFNTTLFPHHRGSLGDRRAGGSSSMAEDDELFREIDAAESEEESEDEDRLERTHTSPSVQKGPSSATTEAPAIPADANSNLARSPSLDEDEEETGRSMDESQEGSRGGDRLKSLRGRGTARPTKGMTAAKRGGNVGGSKKKRPTKKK